MIQETHFYAGIDGGGSKTLAIIVDSQGNECGRGFAGSSNQAAIGLQLALNHIQSALRQASKQADCTLPLESIWLGLAGVDRPADHDLLFPHLTSLARTLHLTNDAELILSALDRTVGVAVIVGTGSIVVGRDESGRIVRAGGWGHVIGDEGSGYAIGRAALQAAVRYADGRGVKTRLLDMILQHWQLQTPSDIIGKVYPDTSKSGIAQLSQLVFQAAYAGDQVAHNIVARAASEIALTTVTVSNKLGLSLSSIPLALAGGLITHETDFQNQVLHAIRQRLSIGPVVCVDEPALSAALSLVQTDRK